MLVCSLLEWGVHVYKNTKASISRGFIISLLSQIWRIFLQVQIYTHRLFQDS